MIIKHNERNENKCKYYFKCIFNVVAWVSFLSVGVWSFSTIIKGKGFSSLVQSESFFVSFMGIMAMFWIYKQTVKKMSDINEDTNNKMREIYEDTEKRNQERKDEELEINKKMVLLKGFMSCFAQDNMSGKKGGTVINQYHPDNLWLNLDSLYSHEDCTEIRKNAEFLLEAWTKVENLEKLRDIDVEARRYYGLKEPLPLNKDYQTEN